MKIIKGNLWDSIDDLILVTGNMYITKDNKLVMGRGAALELKEKFPGIDYKFAKIIKYYGRGEYNVIVVDPFANAAEKYTKNQLYGVFQVKFHFKSPANLELIERSCNKLISLLKHPLRNFNAVSMNFPGIGYGQRTVEEVLPIVSKLPDNVTLYMKET